LNREESGSAFTLIADMHVHFYDCYRFEDWVSFLSVNLKRGTGGEGVVRAAVLAERDDCHSFDDIVSGKLSSKNVAVETIDDSAGRCLKLCYMDDPPLFLFPGRQVNTSEKLELSAWFVDTVIPSGMSAEKTIRLIREKRGLPAINWSPGKWMFSRREVVRKLLDNEGQQPFFLCDTSLRPVCMPVPKLMKHAADRGIAVVAGSDPLPFAGEERKAGSYATLLGGELDAGNPLPGFIAVLNSIKGLQKNAGKRNSILSTFISVLRLKMAV